MTPSVDMALRAIAELLATEIAEEVSSDYTRRNLKTMARLLAASAEEFDRAAEIRVRENGRIRELIEKVLPHIAAEALTARLSAALAGGAGDLRISSLDGENHALKEALILLHAHVETLDGAWARRIEREIWDVLDAAAKDRAFGS